MQKKFTLSEPGEYEVEVTVSGYKKYRVSKNIELGKEYEVAVHLEKESESAPAVKPSISQKPGQTIQPATQPKYKLRSKPITTENFSDFNSDFNSENVKNEFEDNGDGTVTDRATVLMWQKAISPNHMPYKDAPAYIEKLNRDGFSGHSDWRLPTVDELKSLRTKEKQSNDLYINPVFDKIQRWCWTSDNYASGVAWQILFDDGIVNWRNDDKYVRAVRLRQ